MRRRQRQTNSFHDLAANRTVCSGTALGAMPGKIGGPIGQLPLNAICLQLLPGGSRQNADSSGAKGDGRYRRHYVLVDGRRGARVKT